MNTQSKLVALFSYVSQYSIYYKRIFKENNIDISTINTIDDLKKVPFTTKDDLARYNEDFLCVPKHKIVDYVSTSGTLNNPVAFYLTDKDLDRLAANEKESLQLAGATSEDVFQMMVTMDKQFMAGLAYYLGIRELEAGLIRQGPGAPASQLDTILKFKPTILIAIPSFLIKIIEYANINGIDINKTSVKSVICIGESIRDAELNLNALGKKLADNWKVDIHSTYASTEIGAAFTECKEGKGGHQNPNLIILEVLDEEGNQVKDGELGEVVITTLQVEGMPLIRYKTGDLCHVYYAKCKCGRDTPRLGPVIGRKQQMIKYKGTTIFPPSIFDVLVKENIDLYQVNVFKNELGLDDVVIKLPLEFNNIEKIKALKSSFKSKLRVTPSFEFVEEKELKAMVYRQEKRKPEKIKFV